MHKVIDSLYLHFPFCTHLCNYCDFYKKVPVNIDQDLAKYHIYLEQSYEHFSKLIEMHKYSISTLQTLYIGGGTPSLWGEKGKLFLEKFLNDRNIKIENNCEFTLEVNPGAWTEQGLDSWRSFGANRFSLGIQSYNSEMIKYLDRVHNLQDVKDTLNYFGKNNLNFSVDFMIGLPFSELNKRDIVEELKLIQEYKPSHYSVYILTVKDNYPHYKNLPSDNWIEEEYLAVADTLKSFGYNHYEVSNFALPGKHSVHNFNYWESKTVAALGPSATGFLGPDKLRFKWKSNSPNFDIEVLSESQFELEKIYMGLRSMKGITCKDRSLEFLNLLTSWEKRNLGSFELDNFKLNTNGYLILDSLMDQMFSLRLI